jgi:hypothetical protein
LVNELIATEEMKRQGAAMSPDGQNAPFIDRRPKLRASLNIEPQQRTGIAHPRCDCNSFKGRLFGKEISKLLKLSDKAAEDGIAENQFSEQAATYFKIEQERVC